MRRKATSAICEILKVDNGLDAVHENALFYSNITCELVQRKSGFRKLQWKSQGEAFEGLFKRICKYHRDFCCDIFLSFSEFIAPVTFTCSKYVVNKILKKAQ